jgi:hypothetical protein
MSFKTGVVTCGSAELTPSTKTTHMIELRVNNIFTFHATALPLGC